MYAARPPRKSPAGTIFAVILVLLILGGAGYYVYDSYQKEQDKSRLAADKVKAEQMAKLKAQEEAEKARLEKERLALEEAERQRLAAEALRKKGDVGKVAGGDKIVKGAEKPDPAKRVKAPDDDKRLVVYKEPVVVTGVNATLPKHIKTWEDALNASLETNRFDIYRKFLKETVAQGSKQLISFGKFNLRAFYENPKYRQAMNTYRLLSLLSDESIINLLSEEKGEEFFRALLANEDGAQDSVLNAFTGKETPADVERVLKTWLPLWGFEEKGEMRKKYLSLSLACALVDPSMQVKAKTTYEEALELPEVYKFFRDKSEKGQLRGDVTKMKPSELVYVVDVRLPRSEMEWAIDKMKKKSLLRKNWSKAYGMVRYRMDRASTGKNPYSDYKLSEILEHGGICMDQAYFAVNTAKSNGVPASYVTGDGPLGGHAWFVYMADDRTWVSAGGIGYTSGKTKNPQTAEMMHESLFTLTTDKKNGGDRLLRTSDMLEISRTLERIGMENPAVDLIDQARLNTPGHPYPWEALIDYFARKGDKTTLEEWQNLVGMMRRQFKDRPDFLELAKEVEEKYVFPKRSLDQNLADMTRQRRKLERDTDEGRSDLSSDALKRQADAMMEAKRFDDVDKLYRKALRDYGTRTDAFKSVINQYFNYTSEDKVWREKAVKNMEKAFEKYANTKSADLFVTKQEVGIMKTIAGYYRQIGNEKKAKSMEEKGDLRIKRVQRGIREERDRN